MPTCVSDLPYEISGNKYIYFFRLSIRQNFIILGGSSIEELFSNINIIYDFIFPECQNLETMGTAYLTGILINWLDWIPKNNIFFNNKFDLDFNKNKN